MRQDCRLLLLFHCQIYIETRRQRFERWQIMLKYIRIIKNADKTIYNWNWMYCKALYIQNFFDNVIDNYHLFENELFESLETQVCELSQDNSLHKLLLSISYKEFSDEQWMSSERRSLLHLQSHYHEYSADERIHWQLKCECWESKHWIMSV